MTARLDCGKDRSGPPKVVGLARRLLCLSLLSLMPMPVGMPGLGGRAAAAEPALCQSFADAYAARQAADAGVPALFATPFDFAALDWMDLGPGKAVGIVKKAGFTELPGIVGALFCLGDGTLAQIDACADLGAATGDPGVYDRFAGLSQAVFAVTGAGDAAFAGLAATIDQLRTGAPAAGGERIAEFIALGDPFYAYKTVADGALCLEIAQSRPPSGN